MGELLTCTAAAVTDRQADKLASVFVTDPVKPEQSA